VANISSIFITYKPANSFANRVADSAADKDTDRVTFNNSNIVIICSIGVTDCRDYCVI
jgi:hypothetical protein